MGVVTQVGFAVLGIYDINKVKNISTSQKALSGLRLYSLSRREGSGKKEIKGQTRIGVAGHIYNPINLGG